MKRFYSTRAEKIGDRKFRFVISDESVDRHRTVIKMDGWMLENYRKNPIVAYQHDTFSNDPDSIVGKSEVFIDNNRLMADLEFEPEGMNPLADKLVKKIEFGTINTASVGFDPMQWSKGAKEQAEKEDLVYFRKQDLLEWSLVHIPSNPNATQDKEYEEFVRMVMADEGLPETQSEQNEEPEVKEPERKSLEHYRLRMYKSRLRTH